MSVIGAITIGAGIIQEVKPTHKEQVERKKLETAANLLRPMVQKTKIIIGPGAGRRQEGRRNVINSFNAVDGGMLNLLGNINEGSRAELIFTVHHHSRNPILFEGIPIVLIPNTTPRDERINRSSNPIEVLFKGTNIRGQYIARFTNLEPGNYNLKIGDLSLTVFGHPRK